MTRSKLIPDDAYLTQWALAAREWGHPFFLAFDVEMNGWWSYPWSEALNDNHAGDYIKMWRHVHDIFVKVGARNVTWVWSPNIVQSGSKSFLPFYPGDAYVDWVGLDGFNWGTTAGNRWQTFAQVYDYSYRQLQALMPTKPIMLTQWGSSERGGDKAAWITDALSTQLPNHYPAIKGIVWFNWNVPDQGVDWVIESSPAAQAAFAKGIASDYYSSNFFSALRGEVIQPLRPLVPQIVLPPRLYSKNNAR